MRICRTVSDSFRLEFGKFLKIDLEEVQQSPQDFEVTGGACERTSAKDPTSEE